MAYYIAEGAVVKGQVTMADGASVWYNATVRGDSEPIEIGRNSNIQDNAVVHVDLSHSVRIGDNVTIGHSAIVHGCTIGDNTLIGMGAIVLNGARIGKNCIIGAGALVTQGTDIPDHLCRRTKCEASVRNIGALGDKSARTYYAVFTNPCSI